MTSMEERQQRANDNWERKERRDRAREQGDGLFAFGRELVTTHAFVLTQDRKFVPPPISVNDPGRLAAISDEVVTEGRVHRNTRPQRHE